MAAVWQNDFWIALRTDGEAGAGSPSNPYDGSSPTIFDNAINSIPINSTIHLGPGIFATRGFREGYGGWRPKSGQKIVGAGIDATVIKLIEASVPNAKYYAIGTEHDLDSFEASDFTVDCNLPGQAIPNYTFPPIACGAVFVQGKNIRLRRIRAINFGTLDPTKECFVLWACQGTPDRTEAVNCVIEDCIIEKPSLNNYGIITCAILASNEQTDGSGRPGYHRGCAIRNCFLNLEYVDNPVPIDNISFAGLTATVTTKFPHNRGPGEWVVITGALENGAPSANFNGSFQISNVTATTFQIMTPATPAYLPTGEMQIGRYSSILAAIQSITVAASVPPYILPYTATLTTVTSHNRVMGNNVAVNGVSVPVLGTANDYNGSYPIIEIPSPTQLKYEIASNPGTPNLSQAFLGVTINALAADGGVGAVVEGNRVYNCLFGGPYHDSYSTKDLVVRNNYYYGVVSGPYQNMGNVGSQSPPKGGSSLTHIGLIASFNTNLPHGLVIGQGVIIRDADQDEYNGAFLVVSVPDPTTFTYLMNSVPTGVNATGPFKFGALWQVGRIVIEHNIIELVPSFFSNPDSYYPAGVLIAGGTHVSPYVFRDMVVRRNIIRTVNNAFDSVGYSVGVTFTSCENAIVEENIVNLNSSTKNPPYNIACAFIGSLKFFNNQTPGGILIPGYNSNLQEPVNELATDTELSILQST